MSNTWCPDNWVVIKFKGDDPHYRILAGWSGGYTGSDTWRLNSGIYECEETDSSFLFYGSSGSCYDCHKTSYGMRKNNAHVWAQLQEHRSDKVELMPEDTDWLNLNYTCYI